MTEDKFENIMEQLRSIDHNTAQIENNTRKVERQCAAKFNRFRCYLAEGHFGAHGTEGGATWTDPVGQREAREHLRPAHLAALATPRMVPEEYMTPSIKTVHLPITLMVDYGHGKNASVMLAHWSDADECYVVRLPA